MFPQPFAACADDVAHAVTDWRGLAIGVEERGDGFVYRVRMVHDDPVNMTTLAETADEREAVAAWRYWAATLRLPRLVESAPGAYHTMEWRLGALLVRSRAARRRGSPLFARRPARLARRTVARGHHGASVHAGEREIIARS